MIPRLVVSRPDLFVSGPELCLLLCHSTYRVTTTTALAADRLYSLRLEFRESTGGAVAKLMWKSPSQPLEVVPNHRLFHATTPLPMSPWDVHPIPIEPLQVVDVGLTIVAWAALEVTWHAPWDDGGADVEGYKVRQNGRMNILGGVFVCKIM